jgi:transposase-like protein
MDPQSVFCHNWACPARGQRGKGNIGVHSLKERRYICHQCGHTFTATQGSAFYRLHQTRETFVIAITLLAHGCPLQAIVAAFGLDERTVAAWQQRAGSHCAQVQQHVVEQPRDLGQVQADELRVKQQGDIVWMATALQVSTRLWLGGVVSRQRDNSLITALVQIIKACALCRPLLVCVDGFTAYIGALQTVLRTRIPPHRRGRPQMRSWPDICIGQVIKQYAHKHVVGVTRRIAQGTTDQVATLLQQTQGGGQINTAYIERLNATFRARLAALVRRGRALAQQTETLRQAMYLMGTVYNFCTCHESLRLPIYLPHDRYQWVNRTPAVAAGLTDHCWTVDELLCWQPPIPPWQPPKKRGPRSNVIKALMARWCS